MRQRLAVTGQFHGLGRPPCARNGATADRAATGVIHTRSGPTQSPREPAFDHCQMREAIDQRQRYDGAAQQR